jgi:cytochrome o ubiquinol oxidase subunit 3
MSKHQELYPDPYHNTYSKTIFGFWLYLLSDFIFFAVLFATYLVLLPNTYGGPSASDLLDPAFAFVQSLILLAASAASGAASVYAHRKEKKGTLLFFALTFLLGVSFLAMRCHEFSRLASLGHGWNQSAFLSSFFTLVGIHMAHLIVALLWIPVLLFPVVRDGLTPPAIRRIACLKMFWHFLNLVWIFIFTAVYLTGRS